MSNTNTINDFYQVPDLNFDVNKLRQDLDKILKKSGGKIGKNYDIGVGKTGTFVLELDRKLEQLRAMENNIQIEVNLANSSPIGVDTYEDYMKIKKLMKKKKLII